MEFMLTKKLGGLRDIRKRIKSTLSHGVRTFNVVKKRHTKSGGLKVGEGEVEVF